MTPRQLLQAALAASAMAGAPASHADQPPPSTGALPVVAPVDLQRYAGTWYEQARLPNFFQRMCIGQVAATYGPLPDGRISVLNRCTQADGSNAVVDGVARTVPVEGRPGAGRLEVSFVPDWLRWIPLVWGDYWVMQLDDAYQVSLVGTPDRKYLWVLSREPKLDDARLQAALAFAKASGFDVGAVVRTGVVPALSLLP
jgi:apolipoprotein D and lipocalin family protein